MVIVSENNNERKMALKKVKGNFERMFDKNLTDLVRGIRNNKDNEVSHRLGFVGYFLAKFECLRRVKYANYYRIETMVLSEK